MPTTTTRRLIPKPALSDSPNMAVAVGSMADFLDNFGVDLFGNQSSRPLASTLTAKDDGQRYYSVDTKEVSRFRFGVGWEVLVGARGKSIIMTEETITGANFLAMTTPDRVSGILLPNKASILKVRFEALWKTSTTIGTRAALFVGGKQVYNSVYNAQVGMTCTFQGAVNSYQHLGSYGGKFVAFEKVYAAGGPYPTTLDPDPVAVTGEVSTGQVAGGAPISEWAYADQQPGPVTVGFAQRTAHAGEIPITDTRVPVVVDVEVRYQGGNGTTTVTTKNRRLWVEVDDYGGAYSS